MKDKTARKLIKTLKRHTDAIESLSVRLDAMPDLEMAANDFRNAAVDLDGILDRHGDSLAEHAEALKAHSASLDNDDSID
jgi:hypothetical protein